MCIITLHALDGTPNGLHFDSSLGMYTLTYLNLSFSSFNSLVISRFSMCTSLRLISIHHLGYTLVKALVLKLIEFFIQVSAIFHASLGFDLMYLMNLLIWCSMYLFILSALVSSTSADLGNFLFIPALSNKILSSDGASLYLHTAGTLFQPDPCIPPRGLYLPLKISSFIADTRLFDIPVISILFFIFRFCISSIWIWRLFFLLGVPLIFFLGRSHPSLSFCVQFFIPTFYIVQNWFPLLDWLSLGSILAYDILGSIVCSFRFFQNLWVVAVW